MKAILQAPVDLFWNGGIGTYVKAAAESHADVGDKANDAIRVNGRELRAKVVGEGGNLGLTQRGRIEFALAPAAAIYTDFIDNSAGVDCSDHEVNIKILLGGAVTDGELTVADRDELLAEMTDEVAALVLRDNYEQAHRAGQRRGAGALAAAGAPADDHRAGAARRSSTASWRRCPATRSWPPAREAGGGLTAPEFAVLLAYVKIVLEREILDSELPDEAWTADVLRRLLPDPAARAVRRPDGRAPAAPRDRHHRAGQRGGQPGRHVVRLPRDRGDRRQPRPT